MNKPALERRWIHVAFPDSGGFSETYGFVGSQGAVNLEGLLLTAPGASRRTVVLMMHPSSTLQLLPLPNALAESGIPVLCMSSRYARNDTALIFEKVLLDLGACVRYAREQLDFERVVLLGWSGGGALSLFYQAQAERPTITETPGGDPIDIAGAKLLPADGIVLEAAHRSRAVCLSQWIDPSVLDEHDPERRDPRLDLYSPALPVRPPYPGDWLAEFRAAQLARMRRITANVQETLETLRKRASAEMERPLITHRTMAEPRFLDGAIEPNDRRIGTCFLGVPETVNSGPVGLARFSTLRSWLSQWSIDHSRADGVGCAHSIGSPLLAIEHSADDAVPQPDMGRMFAAVAGEDKEFHCLAGANHYIKGQPEQLRQAVRHIDAWLQRHRW